MIDSLMPLLLKPIAFPEPEEITHRSHLDRWAWRAKRRKKILFITFVIGVLIGVLAGYLYASSQPSSRTSSSSTFISDITYALFAGFICSGPFVLLLGWMSVSSGISQYDRLIGRLRVSNRVCSVCDSVALYEDRYMIPQKDRKHTGSDLIPHMNVIEEDGKVNVLCDACLAEVSAMDEA